MTCVAWVSGIALTVGLVSLGALYVVGSVLLWRQGYRFKGVPPAYDGKEPYEQWQAKMTAARATQMKEEE